MQLAGVPGASHLPLILVLLMFSSANARLLNFVEEFFEALNHDDIPHLGYTMACIVLLVGEVVLLRLAVRLLDQAVSFFFCLNHWLTVHGM